MRITGRDKACGTAFSSRVDKIDFLITKVCPEWAKKKKKKKKAWPTLPSQPIPFPQTLLHPHVYTLYLSLSLFLRLYEICSMDYIAASQRLFCGLFPKAFSCDYFSFRRFHCASSTGLFQGWVGLLLQGVSRCVRGAVRLYWSGTV